MSEQIKLGDYNTLKVVKPAERISKLGETENFGIYLDGGDEGDILMPRKYVPEGIKTDDEVTAFVYLDQDERLIATTEKPFAKVGDFAYLKVNWINEYGAFLDWGVMKDVFCPFREMKKKMEIGDSYIVYIHIDSESYRIVASAKVEHFLKEEGAPYKYGEKVNLLVWQKTDLGFKVIVDNKYAGLIYENQIFQYVHTGDKLEGFISQVRPDGKIDVTLQPSGRKETISFAEELLQYLKENDGFCELGDKSEPDAIYKCFHVSKKVYKRAVGDLYKKHLIEINPMGIKLIKRK